jgi:tetratricopeptide (TPR) repeat protein
MFLFLVGTSVPKAQTDPRLPEAAEQVRLYDDPRVQAWSQDLLAGKYDQVLRAVEQDLRSATPHPFAPHVWTVVQFRTDRLATLWAALDDPTLRQALGALPEIFLLFERVKNHERLLQQYPPSHASKINDVWALVLLATAAMDMTRYDDALSYVLAAARLQPHRFQVAWMASGVLREDERVRRDIAALVQTGGEFATTPFGHFLVQILRYRSAEPTVNAQNELDAVNAWLTRYPGDAKALQFKAWRLMELERWEAAAEAFATSITAYPFHSAKWHSYVVPLIRLGRYTEARETMARLAALHAKGLAAAFPWTEKYLAKALIEAGERGKARTVLEDALARWPDDAALLAELAALEIKSNRAAQALPLLRKAVAIQPDTLVYHVQLLEALQLAPGHMALDRRQEAYALFEDVEKRFAWKSEALYARGSQILAALGRSHDRVALCQRAVAAFPGSAWMRQELIEAFGQSGRLDDALAYLRASFALQPPSPWAVTKVRELLTATAGGAQANQELASLRQRFPWIKALWEDAVSHIVGPEKVERQLGIWKQTIAANPGRRWPWRGAIALLFNNERWKQAIETAAEAVAEVQHGSVGDQTEALFDRAIVPIVRLRKETLDRQTLEETLRHLEAYRDNGGLLAAYHLYRAEVLEALGHKEDAAQALLAAVQLRPDSHPLIWALVTRYAAQLGVGRVLAQAHRYLERDPYDGDRLARLIKLNVMWYGSPIIALQLIKKLQERAPDKLDKEHEAMAWGKLGDHARDFTIRYGQAAGIANSDRYIGWYEAARHRAQEGMAQVEPVEPDFKTGLVRIIYPDGQVVLRKDHPVSGKPVFLQVGAARVAAEYDEYGDQLQRLLYSSGLEVRLTYSSDGTVEAVTTNRGDEARFAYNAAKKPTRVWIKDVGEMHMRYNARNEIEQVTSPQGPEVLQRVAGVAKELMQFLEPIVQTTSGAQIPDLPYTDPELERLREAYRQRVRMQYWQDDERAQLAVAEATLALARYLVTHLADRRGYADEARPLLERVIVWAQGSEEFGPLMALGFEAVALWHQLMRETKKAGLPAEDWQVWSRLQDWLEREAQHPSADDTLLPALLRTMEAQPLTLLENARWLPRSYLSNRGYWRHYRLAEVLPALLRQTGAVAQIVLVRQNHDVVVGTGAGLLVLRRGFWEWFGFDESRSRFSATLSPEQLKASSDVLALAEDAMGVLWVGTAKGLMQLPGDYDGEARRWLTVEEGLPTPRVDHSAIWPWPAHRHGKRTAVFCRRSARRSAAVCQ